MNIPIPIAYASCATIAILIGTLINFFLRLSNNWISAIQHFAAGVILATVAIELTPSVLKHSHWLVALGFICGVIIMLLVSRLSDYLENSKQQQASLPFGLITGIGVDLLIDGILIGIAFIAGQRQGILIAIALTIELFSLGLSLSPELAEQKLKRATQLGIALGLGLLLPIGALISISLLQNVSASWLTIILSFGIAALLYLSAEELLTKAHEKPETIWLTACFFLGFLVILLL